MSFKQPDLSKRHEKSGKTLRGEQVKNQTKPLARRMVKCICVTPNTVFPAPAFARTGFGGNPAFLQQVSWAPADAGVTGMGSVTILVDHPTR